MKMPTIDEIKSHLNLEHNEDDLLLITYASAARDAIENHLNRKIHEDSVPDSDSNGIVFNNAIKLAILMLVGHWYDNREPVITNGSAYILPLTYQILINPYRIIPL